MRLINTVQAVSEQKASTPHRVTGFVKSNTLREPMRCDATAGLNSDQIPEIEAYSQNPKDDSCDGVDCGLEC